MRVKIFSRVVRVGLCQRIVEGDQGLRVGWFEKNGVFELPVAFKGHLERGVPGADGFEDFLCFVRLIGGHKRVKICEVRRHPGKGVGIVFLAYRIGKSLYWPWRSDEQRALEFHSGQSLACFLSRQSMVGESYNPVL